MNKRGNGGKEKFVHFLTLKVELHLRAKKVKAQALNSGTKLEGGVGGCDTPPKLDWQGKSSGLAGQ